MNMREAVNKFVWELNAVPTDMIASLMDYRPDKWEEVTESEYEPDEVLPMWGTMWSFSDPTDEWWLEEQGIKLMSDIGFRIYRHEEYGYFFGLDGAGYDFYEAHWIPLYKAMGLSWHKGG